LATSTKAALRRVKEAILVERFEKLPEHLTIAEAGAFLGFSSTEVCTQVISGILAASQFGRILMINRDANRVAIMERLRTEPRAGLLTSRGSAGLVWSYASHEAHNLAELVAQREGMTIGEVVDQAVLTRWGPRTVKRRRRALAT
jgi:hypothetical protein